FTTLFRSPFKNPGEESLPKGVFVWLQKYFITQGNYKPQIVVTEASNERFFIAINIYDNSEKLQQAIPLKEILTQKEYHHSKFEILQALTQLSGFILGLDNYINSAANREIIVYNKEFTSFLMQVIPAIRLLDIDVLLPKSLQELIRPKVSVKVKSIPGKSFIR